MRQIRRAVNEYRDERWDGLVRARNRLVRSAVMTAWTAYGLLVLALALLVPRDSLAAGCDFFIVGALVGLVAQVRSDARHNLAVEECGLTSARLYQTVLASGLAGVAGVLLMPFLAEVATAASGAADVQPTKAFQYGAESRPADPRRHLRPVTAGHLRPAHDIGREIQRSALHHAGGVGSSNHGRETADAGAG